MHVESLKEFSIYTKKLLSIKDAYALRANMQALGLNEAALVENAGYGIASALRRRAKGAKILFICGCGGKAAMGLSAARHMMDYADVSVAMLCDPNAMHSETTKANHRVLWKLMMMPIIDENDIPKLRSMIKSSDIVVDALVGVGLKGRPSRLVSSAISVINASKKHVVSIDVPTGINADTGMPNTASVNADQIFVMHKSRPFASSRKYVNNITIIDVGIPASAETITGPGDVMLATHERALHSNKYENGSVLIIGGSATYHGAPQLAAFAANNALASLRTGSGYVTIAAPKGVDIEIKRASPNLIVKNLSSDGLVMEDLRTIRDIKHDVLVIGPGLDGEKLKYDVVSKLLKGEAERGNRVLVDAGAIGPICSHKNLLTDNLVITPHTGEFRNIAKTDLSHAHMHERIHSSIDFVGSTHSTLVLKGNDTVITDGNLLKINMASTPALATMGTGDVLSGIIASYLAIHKNPFESAVAGVYVHSRIGDLLAETMGNHITASDLLMAIPAFLKRFDVVRPES